VGKAAAQESFSNMLDSLTDDFSGISEKIKFTTM